MDKEKKCYMQNMFQFILSCLFATEKLCTSDN